MKSSFLLSVTLVTLISSAWGQSRTTKVTPAPVPEAKTSFQKFSDRLAINYFAAYSGSSLGQWDDRALDEKGTLDKGYVHNLFNQVSFNYNFGWKMNFVLNPRFTINTGNTRGHTPETNTLFVLEDALVGIQGVAFTSEDKKFNFWMRAGARLPNSRTSRKNNITLQPDIFMNPTYDFTKVWQLGAYAQLRQWVYGERYTTYRYRIYVAPFIQKTLNDTTRLQLYYENYLENRGRLNSQNGKNPVLKDYYQNMMIGVNHDFSPKVNFFPFIGYYVDGPKITERPLDNAWLGFWFSWKLK